VSCGCGERYVIAILIWRHPDRSPGWGYPTAGRQPDDGSRAGCGTQRAAMMIWMGPAAETAAGYRAIGIVTGTGGTR
jgi:hypothetical protein